MDSNVADYHLIHANVAVMRAPFDDPIMADFIAWADEIDELASNSAGFLTMPTPPDEGALFEEPVLLNLSIWDSVENLRAFTYHGRHARALDRRLEWFVQYKGPNYVLFWAPAGHIPSEREIKDRLDHLAENGPTPYAFTFEQSFTIEQATAH